MYAMWLGSSVRRCDTVAARLANCEAEGSSVRSRSKGRDYCEWSLPSRRPASRSTSPAARAPAPRSVPQRAGPHHVKPATAFCWAIAWVKVGASLIGDDRRADRPRRVYRPWPFGPLATAIVKPKAIHNPCRLRWCFIVSPSHCIGCAFPTERKEPPAGRVSPHPPKAR